MKKIFLLFILMWQMICSSQTNVVATVYHAVPEQTNADYLHTAWMFKLDSTNQFKHRIIAVSRDLIEEYPNGTKVRLEGTIYDGVYTVRDKMNKRYIKRIDILINPNMKIGKWSKVIITKIN